jgi:hypothetical protein
MVLRCSGQLLQDMKWNGPNYINKDLKPIQARFGKMKRSNGLVMVRTFAKMGYQHGQLMLSSG